MQQKSRNGNKLTAVVSMILDDMANAEQINITKSKVREKECVYASVENFDITKKDAPSDSNSKKRKHSKIYDVCLSTDRLAEGITSDTFVRYRDNTSGELIMLNLYLNRYEILTAAVTKLMTIDYEHF